MASIFAPPEVFSAYAFFNESEGDDLDLQKGTHFRIYVGLGASFPIGPFTVFKTLSNEDQPRYVQTVDSKGNVLGGVDLSGQDNVIATLLLKDDPFQETVRLDLFPNGGLERAAVIGSRGRVLAERVQSEWQFSGPILDRLRLRGDASDVGITTRMINVENLGGFTKRAVASILAMPLEGKHHWYAGGCNDDTAFGRAETAQPRRLTPMDAPDGSNDDITGHERPRLEAFLARSEAEGDLRSVLERIVDDPDLPWLQSDVVQISDGNVPQYVTSNRLGLIQMAAADPGFARYFGFSDMIQDMPDNHWDTLGFVGLFAFSERDFRNYPLAYASLTANPVIDANNLIENYIGILEAKGVSGDIRNEMYRVISNAQNAGLTVAPMVTFAAPVRPWLAPAPPAPQIFQRRWQSSQNGEPSNLFRASFAFPDMPFTSLSALARRVDGGKLISQHEMICVRSDLIPPKRAEAAAFGHELEPNARLNEIGDDVKVQQTAALLSDHDIPSDQGEVAYAIRAGDFFGRFGELAGASEFVVDPPERPQPPPPVLRFHFNPDELPPDSPAELSPGCIAITVAIPNLWPSERFDDETAEHLGSAIVVPRIDDMSAGSLHLEWLHLELGDHTRDIPLTSPGLVAVEPIQLDGLQPQASGQWTLRGWFTDSDGRDSQIAELAVSVIDRRPPPVYKTGIGLLWTATPGPAPDVELKLKWSAPKGSKHRVYLTDQQGLQIPVASLGGADAANDAPRGLVGAEGCKWVLGPHTIAKDNFTLITEPPIEAGSDNVALLRTTLPRSLATVQFLRVVPLGPDGAEPDFGTCGIVPVAVPESRRPSPPQLEGLIDSATGKATLTVAAKDFNIPLLKSEEPGLFGAAIEDTKPPQYRLRRAAGKISDPVYARPLQIGDLKRVTPTTQPDSFTADVDGGMLEPYVRYVFWAEVRLPPERRVPVGYIKIDGGVTAPDDASKSDHPRPFSAPSSPRALLYAPPAFTLSPTGATASLQEVMLSNKKLVILFADPPRAHALAVERFRCAIWLQWNDGPIVAADNANGATLGGTYPSVEGGTLSSNLFAPEDIELPQLTLRLAYVDPIGRMGPIVSLAV